MRVYYTSPWIPAEWIEAHGLEPRGVWQAERLRPEAASLSEGVCAFADAVQRMAADAAGEVMVFTTACDQMRRGHDALPEAARRRSFLFNLPATWQTSAAAGIYRAEVERLGRFMRAVGGHPPGGAILKQALARRGLIRKQLSELAGACSAAAFAEAVARFHWDGTFEPPAGPLAPMDGVPIALLGGPLCRPHWHLLNTIEHAGGRVALNGTESGERSLWVQQDGHDPAVAPLDRLVDEYFTHMVDVFQRPNTRLYSWLRPRLVDRGVRGIVLWVHTGCDLWRAEVQTLREWFGVSVLLLEADEAQQNPPRNTTRIEAFLETLR